MDVLEYTVFFGLCLIGVACYLHLELTTKEKLPPLDTESLKVESPIERRLYDALIFRGEYVKTQVPCKRYRIDLALPAHRIAIECDGYKYHSLPHQKAHDRKKNRVLRQHGWTVLRFPGKQIYRDLPGVIKRIEKAKS